VATGDKKYLEPIIDRVEVSNPFDKSSIENRYIEKIKDLGTQEFINTEGSVWIDRVAADFNDLQTDRLGGVAISRIRNIYPQNYVSWEMKKPATFKSLATFVLDADSSKINILAYNLEKEKVESTLSVWKIKPGKWRIRKGIDSDNDHIPDTEVNEKVLQLEWGSAIECAFAPRKNTVLQLELIEPSKNTPWKLPDLAINNKSVKVGKNEVTVRVYSQGAIATPKTVMELRDAAGKKVKTALIPSLEAPLDLVPRWTDVKINVPEGTDISSGSVIIDPDKKINQITRKNTFVEW